MAGTRTTRVASAQFPKGLSSTTNFLSGTLGSDFRIDSVNPHFSIMLVPRDERVGKNGTPMAPARNRKVI